MKAVRYVRRPVAAALAAAIVVLAQVGAGASATEPAQDNVRSYAEGLARAATKEFGSILERQRLAQAQAQKPDAGTETGEGNRTAGEPFSWFRRSSREFQALMEMLAGGTPPSRPWDPVADAEKKAAARAGPADPNKVGNGDSAESMQRAGKRKDDDTAKARQVGLAAEAKRAADEAKAAEAKAAEDRKAAEAKRVAEARAAEERKAAEAKRAAEAKAAEDRKAAEAKRAAEAKAAENARRSAEAKQIADARAAEEAKRAAAEAKRAAEVKAAEERRIAEAQRVAEARAAEERKAEEAKQGAAAKVAEERKAAQAKRAVQPAEAHKDIASPMGRSKGPAGQPICKAAGETVSAPGWYVVGQGDTLSAIAWRHYGAARCYRRIHAVNRRRIRNAHLIYPCQRIYLPRPLRPR